jgi:alanyl-tRNA synthetase
LFQIDQAVVSLSDKDGLRKAQTVVNNNLKVYNKELLATRKATAIEFSEQAGQEAAAGNIPVLINTVNFGADGKIAKTMQDIIKKHSPLTSNFFCSLDATDSKVGVYTVATPEHIKAGLDAKDWSSHVIQAVGGGKGGGKSSQATASIPVDSSRTPDEMLELILAAAREYAASKGF